MVPKPTLIWDTVDGNFVLFDLENGDLYELNAVGAVVWQWGLRRGCGGRRVEVVGCRHRVQGRLNASAAEPAAKNAYQHDREQGRDVRGGDRRAAAAESASRTLHRSGIGCSPGPC